MCQPKSEGGRRCASHARKIVEKAQAAYQDAPNGKTQEALVYARAEYYATPTGQKEMEDDISAGKVEDERAVRRLAKNIIERHRIEDLREKRRKEEGLEKPKPRPQLYQGKTPEEWRKEAKRSHQASAESWERSDTDGFLSQAASTTMGYKYSACADLAEQGGVGEFPSLFNAETGEQVPSKIISTRYGSAWLILDKDGNSTGEFVNISRARKAERRKKAYALKGYTEGVVQAPGKVSLSEGLVPHPYIAPAGRTWGEDTHIMTRDANAPDSGWDEDYD